ncbi:MAG: TOMM precursor leader peptide-binding protein [Rhodoglobus sp.]
MILKLDPRYPVVWRSPSSIQVGVDPPVAVIDGVTAGQERLLAALAVGVSDAGIGIVTREPSEHSRALLDALGPAMAQPGPPSTDSGVVAVAGSGPLATDLAHILGASGVRVLTSERADALADAGADLAVAVAHYVVAPHLHSLWLRRDVPHLPIVFSDSAVRIGPLVEPGVGPCLRCLELHHRDLDFAWPAVATQLLGRRGGAESALLASEGASAAARLVLERLASGAAGASTSLRIDAATGERTLARWQPHTDCGCRGIEHLAVPPLADAATSRRSGTDWAGAGRIAQVRGSRTS